MLRPKETAVEYIFCFPIILLRLQLWLALSTDLPNLILRCSVAFNLLSYLYFRAPVECTVLYTAFVSCRHIRCIVIMLCYILLFLCHKCI